MKRVGFVSQVHPIKMNEPIHKKEYEEECTVWGVLGLVLRVSRALGLAPLRMDGRERGAVRMAGRAVEMRASVSPMMARCGEILIVTLHWVLLTAGVLDMLLPPKQSIHGRTLTARALLIADSSMMLIINGLAVFQARTRMAQLVFHVNIVEQIKSKISKATPDRPPEWRSCTLVVGYWIFVLVIECLDVYAFVDEASVKNKSLPVAYLYLVSYVETSMCAMLALQFSVAAQFTGTAFAAVNTSLADLIYVMDLQMKPKLYSLSEDVLQRSPLSVPLSAASVGSVVDTMSAYRAASTASSPGVCSAVRRLALAFGAACDVMRQQNDCFGPLMLLLLGALLIHLLQTPYYLLIYLYTEEHPVGKIALQMCFFLWYISVMLMIIEPGQHTFDKIEKTKVMVGQLFRRISSQQDPLIRELELFETQVALNKATYTPMGICNLTRPLVATMFGGVTTYLVIMLQSQTA